MTRRAGITEATLRRAIKVARQADPSAVLAIRGDLILILPPGTEVGTLPDREDGNSCDALFGTGG